MGTICSINILVGHTTASCLVLVKLHCLFGIDTPRANWTFNCVMCVISVSKRCMCIPYRSLLCPMPIHRKPAKAGVAKAGQAGQAGQVKRRPAKAGEDGQDRQEKRVRLSGKQMIGDVSVVKWPEPSVDVRAASYGLSTSSFVMMVTLGLPVALFNILFVLNRSEPVAWTCLDFIEWYSGVGQIRDAFLRRGLNAVGFDVRSQALRGLCECCWHAHSHCIVSNPS